MGYIIAVPNDVNIVYLLHYRTYQILMNIIFSSCLSLKSVNCERNLRNCIKIRSAFPFRLDKLLKLHPTVLCFIIH